MTDRHESAEGHREPQSMDKAAEERELQSRREFLIGLGKWSRVVIVGAVAGGMALVDTPAQAGWLNRRGRGGGWVNGGGGGGWANRRGGGYGGSWINAR